MDPMPRPGWYESFKQDPRPGSGWLNPTPFLREKVTITTQIQALKRRIFFHLIYVKNLK
jgi:hypothetical protein